MLMYVLLSSYTEVIYSILVINRHMDTTAKVCI